MKNEHSSDAMAEDIIRGIVQTGCAEVHAKTLYEKAVGELENGINVDLEDSDAVQAQLEKIGRLREEIDSLAQVRRQTMLYLYNMYEGDKTYWCQIKHLGIGAYCLFEAYQASDQDQGLLDLAMEANKAFIQAMSAFLGIEITQCAACFGDALKGEINE